MQVVVPGLGQVLRQISKRYPGCLANDAIDDFAGGTRLGASLAELRTHHRRMLVGRRTVVLLISDGLDTGAPETLEEELQWLGRHTRQLLWLNPLLRYDGYAPLQLEVAASGWTTTLAPLAGHAGYVRAGVGLTGVQALTVQPGSALTVRRDAVTPDRVQIGLCGEGPGRLEVTADDERWTVVFGEERCAILTSAS